MKGTTHGGDIQAFAHQNPDATRPLIDLSTGINPVPYPVTFDADAMARLPGRADYDGCIAAFATYAGVQPEYLRVTPGSQSIISTLPTLFAQKHVAILAPTYAEHEICWRRAGHRVTLATASQIAHIDADIIVLTNPNNPDGHVFAREALLVIKNRQTEKGGWLIVDEAFADATPDHSVADCVDDGGLIVLRSFGKFFGLAGIRLGFLIAPRAIGMPFAEVLGPWNVSTPALVLGAQAYADTVWIGATRTRLLSDLRRLTGLLVRKADSVGRGTTLFQLFATPQAALLSEYLAAHGLFVRSFPQHPHWLRFGLPGDEREWGRLHNALQNWER